jgi:hypothetical protein
VSEKGVKGGLAPRGVGGRSLGRFSSQGRRGKERRTALLSGAPGGRSEGRLCSQGCRG